ncbi:iron-containing redox enzyme family protein [Ornithinimicrobium cerasi]|uniref:iron-containing redox enzyme family protein n=1 Tax=Ornithinimicrobium cerasi TaxID=2248773 RepID=UPI000EFF2DA9|nr:iron-containing redox enzyme family protein [Ornithinimicrobium cerasi]
MTTPVLPAPPLLAGGRGPLSALTLQVIGAGRRGTGAHEELLRLAGARAADRGPVLEDDDVQLALFLLYGLYYGWLGALGDDLEWDLELLQVRQLFERLHEAELRELAGTVPAPEPTARSVAQALFDLTAADDGPSLARYVARRATTEQALELLALRSIYTLREADAHSWAIPRLTGRAKAALVEIQADEYGSGHPGSMHSVLFATTMRGVGLDDTYPAYLDHAPAVVLASHNTMSLLGLHHRLRGAVVGHLAAFEMTSSIPNRYYRDGFARLGYGEEVTRYFAEHVEADAVHEQIAAHDLAGALAEQDPSLVGDIMFGAASSLAMDALVGRHVLTAWEDGRSSLRRPLTAGPV